MSEIKNILEQYVRPYKNKRGQLKYRVCMPDGKGGQIRKEGFELKALALEWLGSEFIKCVQNKGQVEKVLSVKTFRTYAEEWLADLKPNISPSTYLKYRADLDGRVLKFFGDMPLIDLSKDIAKKFKRYLQDDKSINNTSRAMAYAIFKRIVLAAEIDDVIPRTGITDLPGLPKNKHHADHWDESELECFLSLTTDHPMHSLWVFASYTGLRAGEIAALKWDCVKLIDQSPNQNQFGHIVIKRTRCQKTNLIRKTTKTDTTRTIPLFREAAEVLRLQSRDGDFVFGGEKSIDTKHFARDLRREAERVGVKPITFHQLRHSFCSLLENRGVERRVVSALLGHSDFATTDRYSHSSDRTISLAVEKFERERMSQLNNKIPTTLSIVK